jgi:hypothetical protein
MLKFYLMSAVAPPWWRANEALNRAGGYPPAVNMAPTAPLRATAILGGSTTTATGTPAQLSAA